jgi:acyl-CoA thioester hydrolase
MTVPPPTSGVIAEGMHHFPIRVYYEDTDAGGIVYHATYLRFAERARSEFLRVIGWEHERLRRETGMVWVVRRAEIDFRQPARLDDALTVATWLVTMQGASMRAIQSVRRGAQELVRLHLQLVLLTATGRPGRLPVSLRNTLRPFLEAEESSFDPCKAPSTP